MTSTGPDHENTGTSGTAGASGAGGTSSSGRSRRRRRRQVHRRAAPPSADALAGTTGATGTTDSPDLPGTGADATTDTAPTGTSGGDLQGDQDTRPDQAPRNSQAGQSNQSNQGNQASRNNQDRQDAPRSPRPTRIPKTFHGEIPDAQAAPFVSLTVATSGIHPTTSRLIAVAAVLYDAEGTPVTFTGNRPACSDGSTEATVSTDTVELTGVVQQINPGEDPGPWHLHGYTEADLGQAPGFATVAPLLFSLLDGRTVICHGTALTWGAVVQEYRLAQRAANRSGQQGANRGRRRGQRRPRKIAVPVPERIVDTKATARRQSVPVIDPRLRAITGWYRDNADLVLDAGTLPGLGAVASAARADTGADELLLADARILMPLHLAQEDLADAGRGVIQSAVPGDLTADRFGLQRSTVRVDATTAPRPFGNPGVPEPGEDADGPGRLTEGMEFVVSPDVATDPDEIIAAGLRAGLVYSEKLNRTSSLVVCNHNHELRGKAMHAHRKNIPLFTDEEFLAALDDVAEGSTSTREPDPRPATPRIPAPQRGGQGRNRNRQSGRQDGNRGARQSGRCRTIKQPQAHGAGGGSGTQGRGGDQDGPATEAGRSGENRNRSRNRNRRRSSGGGRPQGEGQNRQQKQGGQQRQGGSQKQSGRQNQNQRQQGGPDSQGNQGNQAQKSSGSSRSGARRRRRSGANRRNRSQSTNPNQSK